jgi:hypothetical protein
MATVATVVLIRGRDDGEDDSHLAGSVNPEAASMTSLGFA